MLQLTVLALLTLPLHPTVIHKLCYPQGLQEVRSYSIAFCQKLSMFKVSTIQVNRRDECKYHPNKPDNNVIIRGSINLGIREKVIQLLSIFMKSIIMLCAEYDS